MNNVKKVNNFSQFFIIFLTSFLLWIIFAFNVAKNIDLKKFKNITNGEIGEILKSKKELNLSKFWKVYEIILENNYDTEWINKEELVDSAIKWLVDWLWDKHSVYMKPEETKKFNDLLSWDFEWIWAVVEKNILWVSIDRIIKWSPAKKYWLVSWDIIIKANDKDLWELELYDAVDLIKWPAWTTVNLEILRKTTI